MTEPLSADLALDRLGPDAVLSHESAARELGLDLVETGGEHVTLPRNRSRRRVPGWQVHRRDAPAGDVVRLGVRPCTSALRTVHDLSRSLPLDEALAVAESAVRLRQATEEQVRERLAASTGAWAERPRTVASLLAASDSVLESLAAVLFFEAGLTPRRQYDIADERGEQVAVVDFCWPEQRVVVEVDGFAFHSDRAAYRRDRQRLNRLARRAWWVLRFTWEDVRHQPALVLLAVRQALRNRDALAA